VLERMRFLFEKRLKESVINLLSLQNSGMYAVQMEVFLVSMVNRSMLKSVVMKVLNVWR
jgi:hypothetical protein